MDAYDELERIMAEMEAINAEEAKEYGDITAEGGEASDKKG